MKTAIVFGGAGFIGTHLIRELHGSGRYSRIVSADRAPPNDQVQGVEYVHCDVREPIKIQGEFPNAEVYNLAAVHTTPGHEDWEYFWTNVNGAIAICAFADDISSSRMFFLSSISVYGPTEEPRDERGPLNPQSAYGRSKLLAEKISQRWRLGATDRHLVIVRPAVIFGPGEKGNFTRLAGALKRGRFAFPGRSDTIKACAYVGELVRSLIFVGSLDKEEVIYNLAYPTAYTSKDICAAFSKAGGYAMPKVTIPKSGMMLAGLIFEMLASLGLKTSINRDRMLKLIHSTNIVPRCLEELGYEFETDLFSGISRWMKETPSGEFV